jgi:ribosomal protein S11
MSKFQIERWMFMSCGYKDDPVLMVRGNGNAVAVIHKGDTFHKSMQRQRAEAALLAAAPELLDAVETLLMAVEVDKVEGIGHATDKAKAAIAKAKSGGFVHVPSDLLEAAKKIVMLYDVFSGKIPEQIDRDGEEFSAGFLEGIGHAKDLLIGHIAEAEGDSGQAA